MAFDIGRNLQIKFGGATGAVIAAVRSQGVAINREPVDITNNDDDGWRAILSTPGEKQINISLSGITKDDTLRAKAMDDTDPGILEEIEIVFPDTAVIAGDFYLASYNENGEYNGAVTFDCELQSTGVITYTPASP